MNNIKSVCVFCGSSLGADTAYAEKAKMLGVLLVQKGITLVYGGSNVGLMRIIADTMLEMGGKVVGVMPHNLIQREVAHKSITELYVVNDMAERKAKMEQLSDAFIAMPGGVGTFDELFEMMSWNQLELIHKPIALFNVNRYYDKLLQFLDYTVSQRFIKPEHRQNLISESNENILLEKIFNYQPLEIIGGKWIDK